jgi:uncharacterized protein with ATP-grasp and redox domains
MLFSFFKFFTISSRDFKSVNLLNDLKAPLFAELDVSNVQNYIDTKIDTRLDHINDTLDDKIEALIDNKMTVDCSNRLDNTTLENSVVYYLLGVLFFIYWNVTKDACSV